MYLTAALAPTGMAQLRISAAAPCSLLLLSLVLLAGFGFCPRNWLPADGRLLPLAQNSALFALFGYSYGGSGSNFAMPTIRHACGTGAPAGCGPIVYCIAGAGVFPSIN